MIAEKCLAPDAPAVVDLLNRVGVLAKYSGDHDAAAVAYARALELEGNRQPCPRVSTMASLLHNVGGLAHARGSCAEAALAARRGLELRREVCAPDSFEVAADEGALAAILVDLGELEEALLLATHARSVLVARVGDHDHEAVAALAALAAALHRRGDVDLAGETYAAVLHAKEVTLGPSHPELVPTLNNIAVLHAEAGDVDAAAAAYTRAVTILDDAGLLAHPHRERLASNRAALDARREATGDVSRS